MALSPINGRVLITLADGHPKWAIYPKLQVDNIQKKEEVTLPEGGGHRSQGLHLSLELIVP
jgi:hypothetical protein